MNAQDVENLTIAGLAPEIKDRKVSPGRSDPGSWGQA
jgi:hypothetical protein